MSDKTPLGGERERAVWNISRVLHSEWFAVLLSLLFSLIVLWNVPLKDAFLMAPNEGYELCKADLVLNRYTLYQDVWNDQPPVHTLALARAFAIFGRSVFTARCLAMGLAAITLGLVYELARRLGGHIASIVSMAIFLGWYSILKLELSATLDPAMMTLSLAALFGLFVAVHAPFASVKMGLWTVGSGIVYGVACMIKLTALLWLPSFIGFLVFGGQKAIFAKPTLRSWKIVGFWGASVIAGILIVGIMSHGIYARMLLESHFGGPRAEHKAAIDAYSFWAVIKMPDFHFVLFGIGSGIVLAFESGALAAALTGYVVTCLVAHSCYRPFWDYYTIHFALPISMLIGLGVSRAVKWTLVAKTWSERLVSAAGILLLLWDVPSRLSSAWTSVTLVRRIEDERATLDALQGGPKSNRWVFVESPIYAFHADRLLPPWLAVVPDKRIWSGQFDASTLLGELEKFHPGAVAIKSHEWIEPTSRFLQEHYCSQGQFGVYVLCPQNESSKVR